MRASRAIRPFSACASVVAVALVGCSTQVRVNEISKDLAAGSTVDGLPFRTMQRYRVDLYQRVDGKYVEVNADKRMVTLADLERLYVLQMRGMPFSNDTVTVTLNPDNTIKKLTLDPKGQSKEALDKLAGVIGDIEAAKTSKETAAETATSSGEALRLAALQARQAADVAALELAALPSDATPLARKTAENKLALAKLTANQAARKAGQPLPFEDAGT